MIYGCGYPSITSLIEYLNTKNKEWDIVGFLDDIKFGKEDTCMGYPIVGDERYIADYVAKGFYFFNNVASTPANIEAVAEKLKKHNARICTLIFPEPPDINSSSITVGEGAMISPQVIVGAGAYIGKFVVIRQQSIVSHESKVGDYSFIGPNACILGRVKVGSKTLIGAKSLIRENLTIGKNCIIGMGAVVTKSIPDDTIVVGNPAKPIMKKEPVVKNAENLARQT